MDPCLKRVRSDDDNDDEQCKRHHSNDPVEDNMLRKVETLVFCNYLRRAVQWEKIFQMGHDLGTTLDDKSMLFDKGAMFEMALEAASDGAIARNEKTEDGFDNYTTEKSEFPGYKIEMKSGQTDKDYYKKTMTGQIRSHRKGELRKKIHRIIKNTAKIELEKCADFYIFINSRQAMLIDYATASQYVKSSPSGMVVDVPRDLIHIISTTHVDRSAIVPASTYAEKRKQCMIDTVRSYM